MGNQITVYGEGKQTRSFCYVSDLVDGLIRLMNGDYMGPVNLGNAPNQQFFFRATPNRRHVFPPGNPNEMKVQDLAEKVRDLINKDIKIVYKDLPSDDPRKRRPDITKVPFF